MEMRKYEVYRQVAWSVAICQAVVFAPTCDQAWAKVVASLTALGWRRLRKSEIEALAQHPQLVGAYYHGTRVNVDDWMIDNEGHLVRVSVRTPFSEDDRPALRWGQISCRITQLQPTELRVLVYDRDTQAVWSVEVNEETYTAMQSELAQQQ